MASRPLLSGSSVVRAPTCVGAQSALPLRGARRAALPPRPAPLSTARRSANLRSVAVSAGAAGEVYTGPLTVLESKEDYAAFIQANDVCVVDHYTTWCGPCKVILPTVEMLANNTKGKVAFGKFNCELDHAWTTELGVKGMPTFLAFRGGERVDQYVGANKAGLTKWVDTLY